MKGFVALLESIPTLFGRLAGWLTVFLLVVITYDVATRKFPAVHAFVSDTFLYEFISPTKLQELSWHLLAAIFLLSLGWAYLKNAHVRVDIIRERLDPRAKAKLELAGLLLLGIPYFAVMLWFSWDYVAMSFLQGEGSSSLTGIPNRWIIKSTLLIGFGSLLIAMIATALRLISFLSKNDPEHQSSKDINVL